MITFSLQPGEKIIAGIRKHWLVFAIESVGLILAAILPLALFIAADSVLPRIWPDLTTVQIGALVAFVATGWELLIFALFMITLTNYYLDIIVLTNKRVIDIDQKGLFARDIASMPIENVQDVKIEVFGLLAEIFKFGNLHIQTAAESKEMEIRGVRHPERAKDLIMHAYHVDKHQPQ